MKDLQIELTRILVANSARPGTKKARQIEHFFLLGYLFQRSEVNKAVHICVMAGRSILTINLGTPDASKKTIPVKWDSRQE